MQSEIANLLELETDSATSIEGSFQNISDLSKIGNVIKIRVPKEIIQFNVGYQILIIHQRTIRVYSCGCKVILYEKGNSSIKGIIGIQSLILRG